MTQRIYSRGPLTDGLLEYLAGGLGSTAIVLGDGAAPQDAGWTGGQAGVGQYRAYAVFNAGTATPNLNATVQGRTTSWKQPYTVDCYGGSRQQVDWVSDMLKPLIDVYALASPPPGHRVLDLDAPWKVVLSNYTSLGGPSRNDQVDPPIWRASDAFVLWLEHGTI